MQLASYIHQHWVRRFPDLLFLRRKPLGGTSASLWIRCGGGSGGGCSAEFCLFFPFFFQFSGFMVTGMMLWYTLTFRESQVHLYIGGNSCLLFNFYLLFFWYFSRDITPSHFLAIISSSPLFDSLAYSFWRFTTPRFHYFLHPFLSYLQKNTFRSFILACDFYIIPLRFLTILVSFFLGEGQYVYFYSPSSVLVIFSPFIIFPSFFRFFFCHAFIFFNHDHFFSPAYPTMYSLVGVSKSA